VTCNFARLHVQYDHSFLPLGPDGSEAPLHWSHVKRAAEENLPITWDMLGEVRMLPVAIVQEAWGLVDSFVKLLGLGRVEQHFAPPGFVRQQTVPLPGQDLEDRPCVVKQ
jgi:hypothetical protein